MIVDVRRLQRDAIALVDSLDPLDADDRIHADLRERPIDVDLGDVDEQRVGETAHQLAPDPLDVVRRAAPAFVGLRLARAAPAASGRGAVTGSIVGSIVGSVAGAGGAPATDDSRSSRSSKPANSPTLG
ncbi:hypothetical protein AAFM48_32840 [Burkholderia pseudomallei]